MPILKIAFLILLLSPFASAIVGGSAAKTEDFPFIVNIWQNSPKEGFQEHLCGGSLIHKNWVLTAAHCVVEEESESTQRPIKPAELNLFLGSNQLSGKGGRLVKVSSVHIHPDFSWPKNDVALLKLSEPILDIEPILLNAKDLGSSTSPESATVLGWGLNTPQGKEFSAVLNKVTVPVISRALCAKDEFPKSRAWQIGADTLCTQTTFNQKTSCPGDSGGPLVQEAGKSFVQIGIVSWGSACSANSSSDVGGFSDVSNALPWILETIE